MTVELNSQADVWRLFGGEDPTQPGKWQQSFEALKRQLYDYDGYHKYKPEVPGIGEIAKAKKKIKPRFPLTDPTRRYLLIARDRQVCVNQSRLLPVGKAMSSSCQDVAVQYLGADPEAAHLGSDPEEKTRAQRTTALKRRAKAKSPVKNDSVDKIVTSYFAALTAETFEWRDKTYEPRDVWVSPGIVRGYTCPPMCGGCCRRWSLDYIPTEDSHPQPYELNRRVVEFDGREVEVWSDLQVDQKNKWCRNLNFDNGRCDIHGSQPFSCDFELMRSIMHQKKAPRVDFTQKLYGRPWNMERVDGERGALCEMTDADSYSVADVDRRLARLETWMKHFGLKPSRVKLIRAALPKIAESHKVDGKGKGFWITD